MKSVVDKLHKRNVALDMLTSKYEDTWESCSKCSHSCTNSNYSVSQCQESPHSTVNSCNERSDLSEQQNFHLFGDTSRSVIVSRVTEKENKDLRIVMLHCFKDINLNIKDYDIEKCREKRYIQ